LCRYGTGLNSHPEYAERMAAEISVLTVRGLYPVVSS
jgi:fumarate hydratase class II